ncbi:hypothetical protein ColLi_05368 [Colletotrichum liriopes]|uniref:Uncharacterized protein n=1 Tax=Colletotrichum liriopes TaxID=708192 RepID=A0AA37GKY8_9PEZI|nr:hypothetical protein ColLi_05368 [Colletotrichum liriopes]
MDSTDRKNLQLFYLNTFFTAVNESCKQMNNIVYSSANFDNDSNPTPFQAFLCKLAQICDSEKGPNTITALVALKAANGPGYLFASNNRKKPELDETKSFLSNLLDFVAKNPDKLAERPMKRQVLWRILEFNFPRVKWYLKQIAIFVDECIKECSGSQTDSGSKTILQLGQVKAKVNFPRDMSSSTNARQKFLSDCEALIRIIHSTMAAGLSKTMNERASVGDPEAARPWCELRHHLGRLHSYRQAADTIVEAWKTWPELFNGFTVAYIPSARPARLSLPMPTPSPVDVVSAAFPDMDHEVYRSHIEQLQIYNLDHHIQDKLDQGPVDQLVHCEVYLQNFLVRGKMVEPYDYWNNSMFIATSKPPCRLCRYYFNDPDNDFLVQSSHMNVYPKWRLPDVYEGQEEDTFRRREALLDNIIEQMKRDTLLIVKEQQHQWKRNDSRTESWAGMGSRMGNGYGGRSDTRNSGHFSSTSGTSGQGIRPEGQHFDFYSSAADHDYVDITSAPDEEGDGEGETSE